MVIAGAVGPDDQVALPQDDPPDGVLTGHCAPAREDPGGRTEGRYAYRVGLEQSAPGMREEVLAARPLVTGGH